MRGEEVEERRWRRGGGGEEVEEMRWRRGEEVIKCTICRKQWSYKGRKFSTQKMFFILLSRQIRVTY